MPSGDPAAPAASFSPKAFLRSRRPELFSDSVRETAGALDRSLLEYQLETLTKRSQETDFEHFARKLAEKEICPNLIPHTGPTGGGDSKVDSETYPVADALALTWFVGTGREAAQERWAFAFSAKQDWRAKVNSDVKKIAETQRGYKRAYFVSSRFVPDKLRAKAEDELTKKHKVDVRILDRNWILDRVFAGGHADLAIDELKMSPALRTTVRKGAQDVEAEQELDETEKRITKSGQDGVFSLPFVLDCIEACKLSRILERPRTETDGRFARAARAAKEYGTEHLQIVAAYQQACTNYWWFEDYSQLDVFYAEVEKLAVGTENPHELELLHNLWNVFEGAQSHGLIKVPAATNKTRAEVLVRELDRLAKAEGRPSASLHARALRLQVTLFCQLRDKETAKASATLKKLKGVVREAEGLVGFPLAPLVEIFSELGTLLGDLPEYDELFELVVEVSKKRDGEISAARLLVKRGTDQLANGKSYDAIRTLGRALRQLYKHESRSDLVHALGLCAGAYEDVGLLWAARGSLLCAASVATREFWIHSDITTLQAACFRRLKWVELMLGRVPHTLAWHQVDQVARQILVQKGYDQKRVWDGEYQYSGMLGILFLRADLARLKELTKLPTILIGLRLDFAAVALYQALGAEDKIPADLTQGKDAKQLQDFFVSWRNQGDGTTLADQPLLYEQTVVELATRILGCHITLKCQNASPCIEVAESLLAALESFLATSGFTQIAAREPEVTIAIKKGEFTPFPLAFEATEPGGRPHFDISCRDFNPHALTLAEQNTTKDKLRDLIISIVARAYIIREIKKTMTQLIGEESGLERALNFTASFVTLGNIMGYQPKHTLSAWIPADAPETPLTRTQEWDQADRAERNAARFKTEAPVWGQGEPDPKVVLADERLAQVKHSEIETLSLIRLTLWDQAKWGGTGFVGAVDGTRPPALILLFKNGKAGAEIFSHWRREIGSQDKDEQLRITIIRGISKKNPHAYRALISGNMSAFKVRAEAKRFMIMSRQQTMEPANDDNLRRFLDGYAKFGAYFLGHAQQPSGSVMFEPKGENFMVKREVNVRNAWEMGRNDPDAMALHLDDDPIIPPGQANPPILETLAWLKKNTVE